MHGTCIWWKNAFGFVGYGIHTNNAYEGQIYVHYKNIDKSTTPNKKYAELEPNDIVEFDISDGFHNEGTQAVNVRIVYHADRDERQEV